MVCTQSYQLQHENQNIYLFHRNRIRQFFKNTKKLPGSRDINDIIGQDLNLIPSIHNTFQFISINYFSCNCHYVPKTKPLQSQNIRQLISIIYHSEDMHNICMVSSWSYLLNAINYNMLKKCVIHLNSISLLKILLFPL